MLCYNIGCAKNFDPNENKEDSCQYHPKPPVFHDGRKGWDCCNKFSTDFSTCLNMPGCKKGFHSNEKPIEQPKAKLDTKYDTDIVVVEPPAAAIRHEVKAERPSAEEEMVPLSIIELGNVRTVLEARRSQLAKEASQKVANGNGDEVAFGTACQNVGCNSIYKGGDSNKEMCLYHSGEAVFHEGMKFWSCCNRKTAEFDSFMSQEGCTTGTHLWWKERRADCRHDWFQTSGTVTITLFGKAAVPESVKVTANGVKVTVKFDFEAGSSSYERTFILYDAIVPLESQVKVASMKVEVLLKKRQLAPWRHLELPASASSNGGHVTIATETKL